MLEHHPDFKQGFRKPVKILFLYFAQKVNLKLTCRAHWLHKYLKKFLAWSLFWVKMRISLVSKAALAQIFKLLGLWHHHKHLVIEYS